MSNDLLVILTDHIGMILPIPGLSYIFMLKLKAQPPLPYLAAIKYSAIWFPLKSDVKSIQKIRL